MAEIVNIQSLNSKTFEVQDYNDDDISLISSNDIEGNFNPTKDYIEYFVFGLNGNILIEVPQGYRNYTLIDNQISIDPVKDLISVGYEQGQYNVLYNFLQPQLGSSYFQRYYVEEISSDRTEIRLNSTQILEATILGTTELFIRKIQDTPVFAEFYLDFGSNNLIIANNALLDLSNPSNPTVLIKLYEPLPLNFDLKSECWVVEKVGNSLAYNISIVQTFDPTDDNIRLAGPNLNIGVKDRINNSTNYTSYSTLSSTPSSQGSGSFNYQISSLLAETGIEINIDYSSYSNFIQFSSAQTRLENFYYKLALIEQYQYSASFSSGATTNYYVSSSNNIWQHKINDIITNFDGYEYYLYYDSGSTSWPKTNTTYPYINASTGSVAGYNWFVTQSLVAENFDSENNNSLINAIPSYLREDSDNAQYELFIEMIGQHFDNIFVYLQDVSQKYNADNRLDYGVSKDLVADILRDMGIKIYQNNFSSNDLYSALLGVTTSGSLYNLPNTTSSLNPPIGYEYISSYITGSDTGSLQPVDDINKEIYKRIYHNLPYLLKKKGTIAGLRTLITLYGIPDTILRISEFGGKDKDNSNDWDYWQNQFNYAFDTEGAYLISSSFALNSKWSSQDPLSVQLRFQTRGIPTDTGYYSQSLFETDNGVGLRLLYTGSAFASGSYSGSIPSSSYEYAKLDFLPDPGDDTVSASVYLPFLDSNWWSTMITKEGNTYTLYAGNSIYSGSDGSQLGFYASSSVSYAGTEWANATTAEFPSSQGTYGKLFSGSLQEIRYYTTALSSSVFEDYVMNPYSIEGNSVNSAPDQLAFRAALGGELHTGSVSIHPKVTGSWATTSSFASNSTFYISSSNFIPNTGFIFFDQFPAGIRNRNTDKVKQSSIVLPASGSLDNVPNADVLSPFKSIQQNSYVSESYTKDIDYVEVAFSPQNEINDDIISQIGYFNIGEYIGDPRQISSSATSYPDLDTLRDAYFEKYTHNYGIWDYVRLIKYLDNSLFKMIKDWVPARTSLASGVVIKQHLLERNKYPTPQVSQSQENNYTGSISIGSITGSNGGSMPDLQGNVSGAFAGFNISPITQSWAGTIDTLSGSVAYTHSTQDEFFNGELSGSILTVTTQSLNPGCDIFLTANTVFVSYSSSLFVHSLSPEFLDSNVIPPSGELYLLYDSGSAL